MIQVVQREEWVKVTALFARPADASLGFAGCVVCLLLSLRKWLAFSHRNLRLAQRKVCVEVYSDSLKSKYRADFAKSWRSCVAALQL